MDVDSIVDVDADQLSLRMLLDVIRRYISSVIRHYDLNGLMREWKADYTCLVTYLPKTSGIFDTDSPDQLIGAMPTPLPHITKNAQAKFDAISLSTCFTTFRSPPARPLNLKFEDFIGKIAHKAWISDAALNFVLNRIVQGRSNVLVMDPTTTITTRFKPPTNDIRSIDYIVQPKNYESQHWVVMVIEFNWIDHRTHVYMYDPMMSSENYDMSTATWQGLTLPLIEDWLKRDQPSPRQGPGDYYNCGFLCIVCVSSIVSKRVIDKKLLRNNCILDAGMSVCRFKIMHLILRDSQLLLPSAIITSKAEKVGQEIAILRKGWRWYLARDVFVTVDRGMLCIQLCVKL